MVGKLDRKADFSSPSSSPDGYGGAEIGWDSQFTRWCHVHYMRGGESVMSARLDSKNPVVLRVINDPDTLTITSDWQASIDGVIYNIRENPRPTEDRQYLEFLSESGVAI